ncbi:MAG: HAMP domain-containing histidine kinase [Cyclobacteriaceae bacterium]|nr:HAMP domain-containing histidine kinase [Cyclobacteriaceae bacterium]
MLAIFKLKTGPQQRQELINHLAVLAFAITGVMWVFNLFFATRVPLYIFILFFVISAGTYVFNKIGHSRTAATVALIFFNASIYAIASSESTQTGVHMYLGVFAFAALVIFGFEEWYYGLAFLVFSLLLYFAVFFIDFPVLPPRNFNYREIATLFIINALAFALTCSYLFFLVLANNYYSEQSLRNKELQLRNQNIQLVKANTELDRFVYSASHDLRAPLSSIAGIIHLTTKTENTEELKMYLHMIQDRVGVLDKFITDIIQYSRNTRQEAVRETLDLAQVVNEVLDGLRFNEGVHRIEFKTGIPSGTKISTDPVRLRIVLNNLVSNAVRYHDKTKENQFIEINFRSGNPHLEISVKDNGQGIRPEHIEKIFDMFYKTSSGSGGSGLGLYIAREAALRMGASISVRSVYGQGSTFCLLLPV